LENNIQNDISVVFEPQILTFSENGLEAFKSGFKRIVELGNKYVIDPKIDGLYGKLRVIWQDFH